MNITVTKQELAILTVYRQLNDIHKLALDLAADAFIKIEQKEERKAAGEIIQFPLGKVCSNDN